MGIEAKRIAPLTAYLSVIREPRAEWNKLYPLEEVIIITILAVIALARGWEDIERYAEAKKDWLGRFPRLEYGKPPHDVYWMVMSWLKPEEVERCFM